MNEPLYTRRRLLGVTGGAVLAGFAGCTTATQANDEQASSATPTPPVDEHDEGREHHDEAGGHDGEEDGTAHQDEADGHEDDHDETASGHDDEAVGHSDEEHGHGSIGDPTGTADVAVNTTEDGEAHFNPHVTRVEERGTVTWVLESGSHTATAYHPGNDEPRLVPEETDAWDSGLLADEGETFEHTFGAPGVYHYYCVPHEAGGMIGSVIVGEPDAHGQPALAEPPADKPERVREKLAELNEMCSEALGDGH